MVISNIKTRHGHVAERKSQISQEMPEHLCAGDDGDRPVWMQDPCFKAQDCSGGSSAHAKTEYLL